MKKFFKAVLRIFVYILAFILPIVALAAIGFQSTVGVASKPMIGDTPAVIRVG
jgi:hypothetical protein